MITLAVDVLFETFEFVHDECLFSGVYCVDGRVEGDQADTENSCETAEFVHVLMNDIQKFIIYFDINSGLIFCLFIFH